MSSRDLLVLNLLVLVVLVVFGFELVLYVLVDDERLGLGSDGSGYLYAAIGVGGLLGGLLQRAHQRRRPPRAGSGRLSLPPRRADGPAVGCGAATSWSRGGWWFGEIGLIEGVPRTGTVTAVTEALVWRIPGQAFVDALTTGGSFPEHLRGGVAGRLVQSHPTLALRARHRAEG